MVSRAPRALQIALAAVTLGLLGAGVWLRVITAPWHTNLWTVDWLSYYEPQAAALASFRLHAWLGSWEGLHPPLSGAVHGAIMVFGGSLAAQWVATVAAGLLSVVLLRRLFGPGLDAWPWLLLVAWVALSPLQANYGLNTSPYPWALLLSGAATAALVHANDRGGARAWLIAGLLIGLAVETHVLAFAIAIGQALWLAVQGAEHRRRHRQGLKRWAIAVGVLALPMIVGSLTKTRDPWTFHIEEGEQSTWSTVSMVFFERFGDRPSALVLGGVIGVLALAVVARNPRGTPGLLAISIVGWMAALALFFEIGVADPRLSHYYLVPQLLAFALGAVAVAELAGWAGERRSLRAALALVLVGVTGWWTTEAVGWQLDRQDRAHAMIAEAGSTPADIGVLFADAGPGDVVAYLWDHQFLNDEPEYLDPLASAWPIGRIGRRCPEEHPPRGLCNALGTARFYFDPSAFAGELWELEEPLRLMVNQAEPPGEARILLLEGPDRPPHPWPVEVWMAEQGGQRRSLGSGVVAWEFLSGTRIDPPVEPLRPPEDGSEDVAP